jgi:hypothetical protein
MTIVVQAPFRRAPLQSMTLLPVIWDGSNAAGNQVSYTAGSAPSGGQGTLLGYGNIEGGTRSPSLPPGRVTVVAVLGGSRSGYCIKQVCYDTDPASVMPVGSSSNPAAAAKQPATDLDDRQQQRLHRRVGMAPRCRQLSQRQRLPDRPVRRRRVLSAHGGLRAAVQRLPAVGA